MVDSGASGSFISPDTSRLLQSLQVPIRRTRPTKVVTATGEACEIRDTAFLPMVWNDKIAELKSKVLSTLEFPLVLGLDALRLYGVLIDFQNGKYFFLSDPTRTYAFEEIPLPVTEEEKLNNLLDQGLQGLTEEQRATLDKFIAEKVPPLPDKLPCTNVAEHHIEIKEGSKPFKIPCYAIPQALEKEMHAEIDKKLSDGVIEPAQGEWA